MWKILTGTLLCLGLAAGIVSYRADETTGWRHYPSAPKGITLESVAEGLPELNSVHYDAKENLFRINDGIVYRNPLTLKEFIVLFKGLMRDDRVGMSITSLKSKQIIAYGAIGARMQIMQDLMDADMFLSDVTFAREKNLEHVTLPDSYVPKAPAARTIKTVVHFNLTAFVFTVSAPGADGAKVLKPSGRVLEVVLIPVQERASEAEAFQPDATKLEKGELHQEDMANVAHILRNQQWYLEHPRVQKAVRYGEAAAFCRRILANPELGKSLLREF